MTDIKLTITGNLNHFVVKNESEKEIVTILKNEIVSNYELKNGDLLIATKNNLPQRILIDLTDININDYSSLIIVHTNSWDLEASHIISGIIDYFNDEGIKVETISKLTKIPENLKPSIFKCINDLTNVLTLFGITLKKEKPKSAKAQHRWSKEVSEIEFYVDYEGAKATVKWAKRNEMLIKKGAILKADTPLNKDGSIGFAAKFTLQLRQMNKDKIKDFKTIDDIVLKSVNEVGNFLYFAGTNSWLVLKDKGGKTINEWTVIE